MCPFITRPVHLLCLIITRSVHLLRQQPAVSAVSRQHWGVVTVLALERGQLGPLLLDFRLLIAIYYMISPFIRQQMCPFIA